MTKQDACHKLADLNERVYELQSSLSDIESRLRWDDESRRDWYMERKEETSAELEEAKRERDAFFSEYSDIIHS